MIIILKGEKVYHVLKILISYYVYYKNICKFLGKLFSKLFFFLPIKNVVKHMAL